VIDTNEHGLELLRKRFPESRRVTATNLDVLKLPPGGDLADVVFSVGLVEHFSTRDTAEAVRAHFALVKESGLVIITFPTPTRLYRAARTACEFIGVWRFPDERPLDPEEVLRVAREWGTVVLEKTLWPLIFTQYFIAVRVRAAETSFPETGGLRLAVGSE
jgi:cyclopropane fatty-acyl-phospholipid synthase-like methyltransferase